jgi:hypothetical protein
MLCLQVIKDLLSGCVSAGYHGSPFMLCLQVTTDLLSGCVSAGYHRSPFRLCVCRLPRISFQAVSAGYHGSPFRLCPQVITDLLSGCVRRLSQISFQAVCLQVITDLLSGCVSRLSQISFQAVCLQVITDLFFTNGVYCTAQKHAALSSSPVFAYEFSFNGTANVFKTLAGGASLSGESKHCWCLLKHIVLTKYSTHYRMSFTNIVTDVRCLRYI